MASKVEKMRRFPFESYYQTALFLRGGVTTISIPGNVLRGMILESHADIDKRHHASLFFPFPTFRIELIKQNKKKEEGLHVSSTQLLILKLLMMLLCEIRTCVFSRMSYLMSVDN